MSFLIFFRFLASAKLLTMGDRYRDDDRDRNRDRSRDRGGDRPKKQSLLVRNLNTRTSAEELREVT